MKMNQRTRLVPSTTSSVTFQTTSNKCIQLKHKQQLPTSSTHRQSFQRLHRTMKQQSKRQQARINQHVPYNTNAFIFETAARSQRRPTSITSTTTTCASLHSISSLTSPSNYPASTTSLFSLPDSATSWDEYGSMAGMLYMSDMADETDMEEEAAADDQPQPQEGEMTCSANF